MVYVSARRRTEMNSVKQRVIDNMWRDGWVHLTPQDLFFTGDLLFIRDGTKKKELYLVNIFRSARKDAYVLWNTYKDQVDVFYATERHHSVLFSRRKCKEPEYLSESARRRLRSMR